MQSHAAVNMHSNQALNQNDQDDNGQDKLEIGFESPRHPEARTSVGLLQIFVKAPAPLGDAEEQKKLRGK